METRKKKVLIHSNFCRAFTGFGKHKKNLLKHLYKTGKYEIVELCNAKNNQDESIQNLPWKTIGTLPSDASTIKKIQKDAGRARNAGYGHETIDSIVKEEQPDIYLGIEDIWAFTGFTKRSWWNKINCIIHTTLDSLPLLPEAIQAAPNIKNYFVWASFAEKAMHKMGFNHVKTVRGIVEHNHFYKLPKQQKQELRRQNNILEDNFIIGFVFRNQLRKSVPNLLDGFKLFLDENPTSNAKLLLHTHWGEGWDINRLIDEKKIKKESILTTYTCGHCKKYEIKTFSGEGVACSFCKTSNSCNTTNIKHGVSESQLNEIYNLMDVYCHPFTSGGQEIPIQEAKLTGLITLVTNYSCGEDCCTPESGGLPLDWAEYREPGTQFIKASTSSISIAENITKVYNMSPNEKNDLGKMAREFVINNYSTEVVGKIFEECFDNLPLIDWSDLDLNKIETRNPEYVPDSSLENSEWLLDLYSNMLKMNIDANDQGHKYWMSQFSKGSNRQGVYDYFKKTAIKENKELIDSKPIKELIDFSRKNKRIAYIMPIHYEDVFIGTSIVKSLKELYPDHDIYFFTSEDYFSLVDEVPEVYKVCRYVDEMEDDPELEGFADKPGVFDLVFAPFVETKRLLRYPHNGKDKLEIILK